ncbi:MAG: transposase, partial [Nitrosopumilaceae archaeon]|nr:transposase [Nitrosopumilaceae archaeon]
RASDAARPEAEGILRRVEQSATAGFDETHWNDDGSPAHVNVAQSGDCIAISISGSRATLMLDAMDGFGGIAITDGYNAYGRFDAGGRHQACWAHHLRETKHLARKHGGAVRQELHEDHRSVFRTAKLLAAQRGAHSPRLRDAMGRVMRDMMDEYRDRGRDDPDMIKVLGKLQRQVSRMFTFLEYPGVDPTNNASERALRYMVVFRKIIGQTKGGPPAMRRLADFATCVLTWRRQGKSVYEEISRLI